MEEKIKHMLEQHYPDFKVKKTAETSFTGDMNATFFFGFSMIKEAEPVIEFEIIDGQNCLAVTMDLLGTKQMSWFFAELNAQLMMWEQFAKDMKKKSLQIHYKGEMIFFSNNRIKEIGENHGFFQLIKSDVDFHFLKQLKLIELSATSFVKKIEFHAFPDCFFDSNALTKILIETFKPIFPTFSTEQTTSDIVRFYHSGYQGTLTPVLNGLVVELVNEDFEFRCSLKECLKKATILLPLLEKIDTRYRLKAVFKPLDYHFKRKTNILEQNVQEKLHTYLLQHYTADELELFFANTFNESHAIIEQGCESRIMLSILDHYVLFDQPDDEKFFVTKELEELEKEYTERVFSGFRKLKNTE